MTRVDDEDDDDYKRKYAESFVGQVDALNKAWRELLGIIAHELRIDRFVTWLARKLTKER